MSKIPLGPGVISPFFRHHIMAGHNKWSKVKHLKTPRRQAWASLQQTRRGWATASQPLNPISSLTADAMRTHPMHFYFHD